MFAICTTKKNLFFSFARRLFCALVFPLERLFCSLSLCLSLSLSLSLSSFSLVVAPVCGGCFLFFLLSLSLSRAAGFVSHLLWLGSASVFCRAFDGLSTTTGVTVTFCSSESVRRPVGTLFVFWISRCARDAFRHYNGIRRFCYYCSVFVAVILVKLDYYSRRLNNNHDNK